MIDPEQALVALLVQTPAINNLLGGRVKHWSVSKGTATPYAVYQRLDTKRPYSNDGAVGADSALFQLILFAATFPIARTLTRVVAPVLSGYRGTVTTTDGQAKIDGIFIDDENDMPENPRPGMDALDAVGVALTLKIHFQQ
jgi:hypothetical protein